MPTVGAFHRFYWRSRANVPVPPGPPQHWMYPAWQSTVTMSMAVWAFPFDVLGPVWQQIRWLWTIVRSLWWLRDRRQQDRIEQWIARLAVLTPLEGQVLDRV